MLLVPSQFSHKIETIKEIKYVTYNGSGNNIRLDNISLKTKNGKKYLERFTHFGKFCGTLFDINDFTYSKTDIESGELESVEASTTNAFDNDYSHISSPYNFIGIDGEKEKEISFCYNKDIYNMNKLNGYIFRKANIVDNVKLPMNMEYFEDTFNIEYSTTLGNLVAISTNATISIPFRCDVIFDSKFGFNITNVKLLLKDSDVQTVFIKEIKGFTKAIEVLYKTFKNNCINDNRNIRIYISIREFDTYIKFTDNDIAQTFELHLNNSDHSRAMMSTLSNMGRRYSDTESFGDLIETKCKMLIPSMFDSEDRRFTFMNNDYTDNFPVSYF